MPAFQGLGGPGEGGGEVSASWGGVSGLAGDDRVLEPHGGDGCTGL